MYYNNMYYDNNNNSNYTKIDISNSDVVTLEEINYQPYKKEWPLGSNNYKYNHFFSYGSEEQVKDLNELRNYIHQNKKNYEVITDKLINYFNKYLYQDP